MESIRRPKEKNDSSGMTKGQKSSQDAYMAAHVVAPLLFSHNTANTTADSFPAARENR